VGKNVSNELGRLLRTFGDQLHETRQTRGAIPVGSIPVEVLERVANEIVLLFRLTASARRFKPIEKRVGFTRMLVPVTSDNTPRRQIGRESDRAVGNLICLLPDFVRIPVRHVSNS
jgi:hypothetical protein